MVIYGEVFVNIRGCECIKRVSLSGQGGDRNNTFNSAMSAAVYKALRSCWVKLEGTVMTQSLITLPPKFNVMSLACCRERGR